MSASWIHKLNESDSRLHKEEILNQAVVAAKLGNTVSERFLLGLSRCYDPYTTFGVKQVPSTENLVGMENPYDEFFALLDNLSFRNLTGSTARDSLEKMSLRFDSDEWNTFLAPIIRRDMRCGISTTTINKVCKNTVYTIPVFACQLATNSENRPEMRGIKRLEPKLDGVRVLMTVHILQSNVLTTDPNVVVSCYSRNGKVFENFSHIENQVARHAFAMRSHIREEYNNLGFASHWDSFVLDGEITGTSFQELMKQARRKEDVKAQDSVFHIFDILPLVDFSQGHWNLQLSKRIRLLESIRGIIDNMANVELLPYHDVDLDTLAGKNQLTRYANDMVNMGYEGIMIKNLDAPYECKRNTFWMKWKPVHDYDLTVVAVEPGTGKNKGRMGALVCEGIDDGKNIVVNVGSGFTDTQRQEYWDDQSIVIGQTAVVMADAITKNQDGTYSLRFPRFKTFRTDK